MYSTTNGGFTRGVIKNLYELMNPLLKTGVYEEYSTSTTPKVCPVAPGDEFLLSTEKYTLNCPSRKLERVKSMIEFLRIGIDSLIRIIYVGINMCMAVLRIIVDEKHRPEAISELSYWAHQLYIVISSAFQAMTDLAFQAIFGQGMGAILEKIVYEVCRVTNEIQGVVNKIKAFLANLCVVILKGINDLIHKLSAYTVIYCSPIFTPFLSICDKLSELIIHTHARA